MNTPIHVSFNRVPLTMIQLMPVTSEIIFNDLTRVTIDFEHVVRCFYDTEAHAYIEQRLGTPMNFSVKVTYEDPACLETTKEFADHPQVFSRSWIKSSKKLHEELVTWCAERHLDAEAIYASYLYLMKPHYG